MKPVAEIEKAFSIIINDGASCAVCHGPIAGIDSAPSSVQRGAILGRPSFSTPAVNVCFACLCEAVVSIAESSGIELVIGTVQPLILEAATTRAKPRAKRQRPTANRRREGTS